jgi:hypothetical protein
VDAHTKVTWKIEGEVRGSDGFTCTFLCDDSFRSWWAIVRWNVHYGHWGAFFRHNLPDLFRKQLRSKMRWRHS